MVSQPTSYSALIELSRIRRRKALFMLREDMIHAAIKCIAQIIQKKAVIESDEIRDVRKVSYDFHFNDGKDILIRMELKVFIEERQ